MGNWVPRLAGVERRDTQIFFACCFLSPFSSLSLQFHPSSYFEFNARKTGNKASHLGTGSSFFSERISWMEGTLNIFWRKKPLLCEGELRKKKWNSFFQKITIHILRRKETKKTASWVFQIRTTKNGEKERSIDQLVLKMWETFSEESSNFFSVSQRTDDPLFAHDRSIDCKKKNMGKEWTRTRNYGWRREDTKSQARIRRGRRRKTLSHPASERRLLQGQPGSGAHRVIHFPAFLFSFPLVFPFSKAPCNFSMIYAPFRPRGNYTKFHYPKHPTNSHKQGLNFRLQNISWRKSVVI